jgi:cytochrome c oxidase subunit 1
MSDAAARPGRESAIEAHGSTPAHGPPLGFLRRHVFSLDHKVIGKQYLDLALVAVTTGMILSWLMRIHLAWPSASLPGLATLSPTGAAHGVITPEYYLSLMTMHGTIMVFFVLTTAPFAGFGNFILPIQVGWCCSHPSSSPTARRARDGPRTRP